MRCGAEIVPVRAAPSDDAEQVTQALRGEPLEVAETRGGWARITTAYGYEGWLREEALCAGDPVTMARSFLGSPYEWGGLSVRGLDCSGLVHLAYRLCGQLVPRDSWQQEEAAEPVEEPAARSGDIVTYGQGRADHVAFWLGEGRILHATARAGLGVVEEAEPEELRSRRRRFGRL